MNSWFIQIFYWEGKARNCNFGVWRFTTNPFQMDIWVTAPPQIGIDLGGAVFLFCTSIGNVNWKKFLRWKLLGNICSSELKQNHQTKTYTCEFENFSDKFFPIFGRIETFLIIFVITYFFVKVTKVTKVHVDAILRKKMQDTNQKKFTELRWNISVTKILEGRRPLILPILT